MDLSKDEEAKAPRYFVNPEITWKSEDLAPYEEGCLSVPDIYDEIERPAKVRLRYLNYQGEQIEEDAEGLFAVCIQHEMDHLKGKVFVEYLSPLKRDLIRRKIKKMAKAGDW